MTAPTVLITGGAKRLGGTLGRAFGKRGWHVVVHYNTSGDAARELADSLPDAEAIGCDLTDPDAAEDMVRTIARQSDDWPVLINCAAVFRPDPVDRLDEAIFDQAMAVNARASAVLAQAYFRNARAKVGRRVIQFTDQKIANTNPDFFSYTMSKHAAGGAVAMMSRALSDPRDRVYGIAPGAILASHDQSEKETDISHRLNLLRRKTGADEIAEAALFLADGWVASGETLFVDSGQHLMCQPRDVIYLARQIMGRTVEPQRL